MPSINTQHLQSLSKLQLPAFKSYSNSLKIMLYISFSWYTFLSGKLKPSKTLTIPQLTHFSLFFLITDLAVHRLASGEMCNEKSDSSARVYLINPFLPTCLWTEDLPLRLLQQSLNIVADYLKRYKSINQTCYLFPFFFPSLSWLPWFLDFCPCPRVGIAHY